MNKEMLTVEFRFQNGDMYDSKTITIGMYDTLEDAIDIGNNIISELAKHFHVREDDNFKLNHLYGTPKRLVSNVCYSQKITFFAKITKLNFGDLNQTIDDIKKTTNF